MRLTVLTSALAGLLLTSSCSEAQSSGETEKNQADKGKKEGKKGKKNKGNAPTADLQRLGELSGGVPESSGLARGPRPGTFYTHADAGNAPVLFEVDAQGKLLNSLKLPVENTDWESLAQDNSGNIFVTDAGNNNNSRRDLVIYRLNPSQPQQVGRISFAYADQSEFPPTKSDRNFDCEASLWHNGQLYLFTKDRAQHSTSKVYTLPDQPGKHTAKLLTKLSIAGEVTGADLSPDGRHLALLGREQLFLLEGNSLDEALKATPKVISLSGAGQTEGVVFTDNGTLVISTEQGAIYQYKL
ncbi:hypothetical protein HER32_15145 [Hymenobacter sp. BT18]|uniref:hypothetical protein n=1 Tax=Hymenobacter sp. BT18 TaxID=2835648 RepID=UPI00143E7CA9|nr:hypothetical protein [Hymenobacter sp. BT18]QIX62443.1 hypothetical protein HER32_15145 [Hymenobacter sp. BT18]